MYTQKQSNVCYSLFFLYMYAQSHVCVCMYVCMYVNLGVCVRHFKQIWSTCAFVNPGDFVFVLSNKFGF